MKITLICFLLSASLLITGCTVSKKVTDKSTLTPDELIQLIRKRNELIKTFYAEGTISIDNKEISNSGSFRLSMRLPDSVKLDIRGPLGIRVATILVTENQEIYYDWMENRVFSSKNNGNAFNNFIPLQFNELISTITSGTPSILNSYVLEEFKMSSDNYIFYFKSDEGEKNICIDRYTHLGISFRSFEKDTIPELSIHSSDNIEVEGLYFPLHIDMSDRNENNISIDYDDIKINEPITCSFVIPKSAKIVDQ
ncbi:MAG: DUF4292 domain-containing protein [Ignavibacteriales bacterium]|nr:DUF4292 domain-containing protein [Ignavibacteriales bacterium]